MLLSLNVRQHDQLGANSASSASYQNELDVNFEDDVNFEEAKQQHRGKFLHCGL